MRCFLRDDSHTILRYSDRHGWRSGKRRRCDARSISFAKPARRLGHPYRCCHCSHSFKVFYYFTTRYLGVIAQSKEAAAVARSLKIEIPGSVPVQANQAFRSCRVCRLRRCREDALQECRSAPLLYLTQHPITDTNSAAQACHIIGCRDYGRGHGAFPHHCVTCTD